MSKKSIEIKVLSSRKEAERYKQYLLHHGISSCRITITKGIDLETKRAITLYNVIVNRADTELAIDRVVDLETEDEKPAPSENDRCPVCRSIDSKDIPRSLLFRITALTLFFIPYFVCPRQLQCSKCSATWNVKPESKHYVFAVVLVILYLYFILWIVGSVMRQRDVVIIHGVEPPEVISYPQKDNGKKD